MNQTQIVGAIKEEALRNLLIIKNWYF